MLEAGEAEGRESGIAYNIAIVDARRCAHSIQPSGWCADGKHRISRSAKAVTARLFDKTTAYLSELAQPGAPLFGIEQSNGGRVIIFGGGAPVCI